jgi:hypothetical protein
MYERFILTESLSGFFFTLFLLLALEYVRSRHAWALILLNVTGIVLVSFRVTFVPAILLASVVLPFFTLVLLEGKRPPLLLRLRQFAIHLAISLALFFGLHSAYKSWNGSLSKLPPAYTYADGFFLLSNVSPLVKPDDTDNPIIADILRQPLVYGSKPSEWNARNAEMFSEDGLAPKIQRALKDDYYANQESRRIAWNVIFRDPIGFTRLAVNGYLKFFSRSYLLNSMQFEAGMAGLSKDALELVARFHLDATELTEHSTVTRFYYLAARPYYVFLIHTPLVLIGALFVVGREFRKFILFLLILCTLHVVVIQVLGVEPSVRHNHAVAVFLAIAVGVIVERFARAREAK